MGVPPLGRDAVAAVATYRGPAFVVEWVNEEYATRVGRDVTGMPMAEAFPEERWRQLHELMRLVFTSGRPVTVPAMGGWVSVLPRCQDGQVTGLTSVWEPLAPPVQPEPQPEPRPLATVA
jgi:hypothetical protein